MFKEILTSLLVLFSSSSNSLVNASNNLFSQNAYAYSASINSININSNVVSLKMSVSYTSSGENGSPIVLQRSFDSNFSKIDSIYSTYSVDFSTVYEDTLNITYSTNIYYRISYWKDFNNIGYSNIASVYYNYVASTIGTLSSPTFNYKTNSLGVGSNCFSVEYSLDYTMDVKLYLYINDKSAFKINELSDTTLDYLPLDLSTLGLEQYNQTLYFFDNEIIYNSDVSSASKPSNYFGECIDTSLYKNGSNTFYFKLVASGLDDVVSSTATFTTDLYSFTYDVGTFETTNNSISLVNFRAGGKTNTYYCDYYLDNSLKYTYKFLIDSNGNKITLPTYTFSGLNKNTSYAIKLVFRSSSDNLETYTKTITTANTSNSVWFNPYLTDNIFTFNSSNKLIVNSSSSILFRSNFSLTSVYLKAVSSNGDSYTSSASVSPKSDSITIDSINYTYYVNLPDFSISAPVGKYTFSFYAIDSNSVYYYSSKTWTVDFSSNNASAYVEEFATITSDYENKTAELDSFLLYSTVQSLKVKYYLNDTLIYTKSLTGVSEDTIIGDTTYKYTFSGTDYTFSNLEYDTNYIVYCEIYTTNDKLLLTTNKETFNIKSIDTTQYIKIKDVSISNISYYSVKINFTFTSNYLLGNTEGNIPVQASIYLNDKIYVARVFNIRNNVNNTYSITLNNLTNGTNYDYKLVIQSLDYTNVQASSSGDFTTLVINNYEVINLPSLLFDILTMPFAFFSQAFNLTIFSNTPFEINFGNVIMFILSIVILITIIKLIMNIRGK